MQTISLSAYARLLPSEKQSRPVTATPLRFGNAIYERNRKFNDTFERTTTDAHASEPSATGLADALMTRSRPLYNESGRFIKGNVSLKHALRDATTEYELRQAALGQHPDVAARQAVNLAGVRLANIQLAVDGSDKQNSEAFHLLSRSLNQLDADGYANKGSVSPAYIHGLYNRGTYTFNNDLYRTGQSVFGNFEMRSMDFSWEGLGVAIDDAESSKQFKKLKNGLPYLDKAIELAGQIPDHNLAKAEYQIAKGEVHHAMAHLSQEFEPYYTYSQESRDSFAEALRTLEDVAPEHRSAQHKELIKNLTETKIPHLCEPTHRVNPLDAHHQCGSMNQDGNQLATESGLRPFSVFRMFGGGN